MTTPTKRKPPILWEVTRVLFGGTVETRTYTAHTAHAAMRRSEMPENVDRAISATPVIPHTEPTPIEA